MTAGILPLLVLLLGLHYLDYPFFRLYPRLFLAGSLFAIALIHILAILIPMMVVEHDLAVRNASLEAEVRKALAGIEKGIDVLAARQAELRGEDGDEAAEGKGGATSEEGVDRDVDDWPDVPDGEPAFLREEDAGQTVPR